MIPISYNVRSLMVRKTTTLAMEISPYPKTGIMTRIQCNGSVLVAPRHSRCPQPATPGTRHGTQRTTRNLTHTPTLQSFKSWPVWRRYVRKRAP